MVRCETYFTRDDKSTINLILTNKPKSFQNTCITETTLSGSHKLILSFLNYVWTNKDFWKLIKPFLSLAKKDETLIEEKESVGINHYINIVERSCRTKSTSKGQKIEDNKKSVEVICKSFVNHEIIKAIKKTATFQRFLFWCRKTFENIDSKKSRGMDKVPPKLIKLHAKFFQSKSCKIICRLLVIAINNSSTEECSKIILKKHEFLPWINTLMKTFRD